MVNHKFWKNWIKIGENTSKNFIFKISDDKNNPSDHLQTYNSMRNNQFVTGNHLLSNDNAKAKEEAMIKGKVYKTSISLWKNPKSEIWQTSNGFLIELYPALNRMKNYSPQLGPFINMQGDISAKQMLNRMFTHSLEWKELTVNAFVRKSNIKPDVTKIYKSKDVPSWCLQDLPLIVVPHPDFDRYGEATRAQLRILSTLAIEELL